MRSGRVKPFQVAKRVAFLVVTLLACTEIISFLVVTATNFVLYGQLREGSRAVYDPYTLFLQSAGVRPTAYNSSSPNREKNRIIWMFGGSTMRGATDFDERTIPSYLAQYLNSQDKGLRFTVINYGTNSFNSLLETKYLQKLIIEEPQQPDVIVFYDGANDSKYFAEHRTPDGHHGYRRVRGLIESYYRSWLGLLKPLNAAVYSSFTKELYDRINQAFIPVAPDSPMLQELAVTVDKRYDHVNRLAACFGARFVLFWQPMLWVEECRVPAFVKDEEKNAILAADRFGTMRHNFTTIYEALGRQLKEKPYFVTLRNALCERQTAAYVVFHIKLTDLF